MPRVNFAEIEDTDQFNPLPPGRYRCKVANIDESDTKHGDLLWKLRFEVVDGPHEGRLIFDNLPFSEAALKRVKLFCSRLGLDVTQEVDLTPEMLLGRECFVAVEIEEYPDGRGGLRKRNTVPFAGFERIEPAEGPSGRDEDGFREEQLPF